jgi:hypothetical protein
MISSDDWDQIVSLIRHYALRKYGDWAAGITIHLPCSRQNHYEPFPAREASRGAARPGANSWGTGPVPKRTDNFSAIYWPGIGTHYFQGEKQQAVAGALWRAREDGILEVNQAILLRAADSDGTRLHDLFRGHPAWGTLIIRGPTPGCYTLPPLSESADEEPAD